MSDLEIQLQRMERILEISHALTSTVSLESLLHQIVEAAAELTDSEMSSIMLLNERTGDLRFMTARNLVDQLVDIPVPLEGSIAGIALSSGEPLIVPDARTDPHHHKMVDQLLGFETRSLLAVPLRFKDRRIGVLEVENKRGGEEFGPEDVETLTALAAQATVAIENTRMVNALQESYDELEEQGKERDCLLETEREQRKLAEALRQASAALSSTLNYDDVLDRILEQMSHVVAYDAANVMLIEGSEGEEVARVFRGRGYERFGTAAALTSISLDVADTANLRKMQQTGQPLAVPYVERDAEWVYSRPEHTGIKSYVGVPIRIRDRTIGFLNVNSATPGFFSQADAEGLQAFADHVAIAIENARLYDQARRELAERVRMEEELRRHRDDLEDLVGERTAELVRVVEQLEREVTERVRAEAALQRRNRASYTLLDAAKVLSTTLRFDKLLECTLDELQRVVPYDAASISMLRDEHWWIIASRGLEHTPSRRFDLNRVPLVRRVVRERGPILVPDVRQEPDWRFVEETAPVRSWLGVPLITRGEAIGILMIDSHRPDAYDEEAARLAFTFAHHVALALENSRLYEQVRAKLREATQLHSVTMALSSTLDMDQILPYVAHSLCEILNSTSVEICSLDEDTNTVAIVSEYVAPEWVEIDKEPRAGLEQTYALDGLPVTADILAQRLPVQARVDEPGASPYLQTGLRAHDAQATLLLPMVVGDRVLGFAQVWEGKTPRHFTEGEVATGQILVNQAAITVDNARLVEALRQRTVELQARNEELDAFAHTVAHDLKNPLAALITFSGLLERRFARISSDKKFLDNLQMMTQSGRKINTIINELLLLTSVRKLEEVTMEPLDMASVVAEVQRRLADLIEEHRAEITVMGEWPVALGRGPWVEEVWANYVSNALKYGGQPPRVELGATEQEDGTVRFWVRDNGPGLTPEEQAQLFTPFTRLDQVRTEGHGLGLSIVRRIVEKLGGQVGVESTPGQGSTFFFALPRALQWSEGTKPGRNEWTKRA